MGGRTLGRSVLAIVKEPKAFLFDEPLSNLDAELRVRMRSELVALHQRLGSTMVYVTHDQVEAMTMADQIVVLRDGVVEQVGTPVELYARPKSLFVAGFLGAPQMNFIEGTLSGRDGRPVVELANGTTLPVPARETLPNTGANVTLGIRPEHVSAGAGDLQMGDLQIKVDSTEILGSETIIHALLPSGLPFTVVQRGISRLKAGDTMIIGLPEAFTHVFNEQGESVAATADWRSDYVS